MISTKLLTVSLDDEISRFLNTEGLSQLSLWDQTTLLEQGINYALDALKLDYQGHGLSCLQFKNPNFGLLDNGSFKQSGLVNEHGQMVCEQFTLFCLQVFMRLKFHKHLVTHQANLYQGEFVFHRHHLGVVYLAHYSHRYS